MLEVIQFSDESFLSGFFIRERREQRVQFSLASLDGVDQSGLIRLDQRQFPRDRGSSMKPRILMTSKMSEGLFDGLIQHLFMKDIGQAFNSA